MLHLRTLLLLFSLYPTSLCCSQSIPVVAASEKSGYVFINKYTEVLKVSSLISLDSVLRPSSQKKFVSLQSDKVLFKGYDPYYYWYRFTLYNGDTAAENFVLLLGGLGIKEVEIWEGANKHWVFLGKSGYQYPFTKRAYPYVHQAFPISITAKSTNTFYIKIDESHAYKSIAFVLVKPYKMVLVAHRFYFLFGIITGLLALFFIFNFYLFITIKEKIHLWYAFYLITILFFLMKNEGLDAEFIGLDSYTGYRSSYMAAVADLSAFFLMQFVQLFLVNLKKSLWLYRIFEILKWTILFAALTEWLVFYFQSSQAVELLVFKCARTIGLVAFAMIIVCSIYSFYKGFKPSLFVLVGQSLFLIGGFSRTLFLEVESVIFPPSLFEIGLVVEVFVISYGLMYRYSQYKKDKEILNAQLEWQQTQAARQMVLTQEAEQKRIAEDLHDELGGNLAAIKMTLQSFTLASNESELLIQLLDKASTNARNIAHNLMPPEFEQTRLEELLQNHYDQLTKEGTIAFRFYNSGNNCQFDKQDELMIYRIVMELTNNIIKHSKATEATIQLVYHTDRLAITAEDNGQGILPNSSDGIGLKNIRSRVSYLNGFINIDSSVKGSTVVIYIPYKK